MAADHGAWYTRREPKDSNMTDSIHCFKCKKVFGVSGDKCPSCGGTNIELLSPERVREGMESGAYFNIDLRTGERAKPKRK
jgi:hypothetical protein